MRIPDSPIDPRAEHASIAQRACLRFETPHLCATAPALGNGEIGVRAFRLDAPPEARDAWAATLDADERARAARFVREADRNAYVVAHGVLREVLSSYLGVAPARVRIRRGVHGKPSLEGTDRAVSFNLAHSGGRAIVAVTRDGPVGVDLECERDIEALALARHYFTEEETGAIMQRPAEARRAAFFRHWVAKEAVLKGVGTGLLLPLERFEVRFAEAGDRARVISRAPERIGASWTVRMLPTPAGWHAAIATEHAAARLCFAYETAGSGSL
jgi:4'-phosphopantetheinyl transferase